MESKLKFKPDLVSKKLDNDRKSIYCKDIVKLEVTVFEKKQVRISQFCSIIKGRVNDSSGKPVNRIIVKAVGKGNLKNVYLDLTDEEGCYCLRVEPGEYKVFVLWCSKQYVN